MNYVSSLGTVLDLDAVYRVADTLYPDSRFMDPEEAAESHFGRQSRLAAPSDDARRSGCSARG